MGSSRASQGSAESHAEGQPDDDVAQTQKPGCDPALWHGRGHGRVRPFSPLSIALLRLRHAGSLVLTVALGILVAATLLCTVPLYTSLVSDARIQYLLASAPKPYVNIEAEGVVDSVAPADADAVATDISSLGQQYLSAFAPDNTRYLDAGNIAFTSINGAPLAKPDRTYGYLASANARPYTFDYSQAAPHMQLYAGRLPRDVPQGQMPEVLVTPRLDMRAVHVGDVIGLQQIGPGHINVSVRVVGIWFPKDQNDPFWNGHSYDTSNFCATNCPPPVYPLLFTRSGFFQALAPFVEAPPGTSYYGVVYPVNVHAVYFTQPSALHASTIATTLDRIASFRHAFDTMVHESPQGTDVFVATRLDTLLATAAREATQGAVPLYIVVAQLVGLVLLFIVAVAVLLIEARGRDIATLTSRGASRTQLILSFGLLTVGPAALMAVAGAFIASRLAIGMIVVFEPAALATVGPGYYAADASPIQAAGPAQVAGALGVLAVMIAVWLATRTDMLAYRQAQGRSSRPPFWKRYYLDLGLAIVCLAGYIELGQFGGLSIRSQLGMTTTTATAAGADPLQVAAPALLVLAGALIVLRVLAPAARLCSRLAARGRGAARMLAFAQAERASGQFTRLTLLVTLAVAFSFFALTYQSVLARNSSERAAYTTGGDLQLTLDDSIQGTATVQIVQSHVAGLPGVEAATPIVRALARTAPDQGNSTVGLLGIDPSSFARAAYWNSNYADQPLSVLLAQLRDHVQGMQAGDNNHPMWALVSDAFMANLNVKLGDHVTLVLRDGAQGTFTITVGAVVHNFPTMFNSYDDGYLVVDGADLDAAYANMNIGNLPGHGPIEYWLRTTGRQADDLRREQALQELQLSSLVAPVTDRRALTLQYQSDPVTAGMSGLLFMGAVVAVLLAGLAGVVQARASARVRLTQLAVMRTLGMTRRQLRTMIVDEHLLLYTFGLVGGTVLGLLLSTATLPFLGYVFALQDPATVGVPPYVLSFNPLTLAIFYAILLLLFALALLLESVLAARSGLGRTLRLGDD